MSRASGKEAKDAKDAAAAAAATPAKGPPESAPEPGSLPQVANLLQFVAWVVCCNSRPQPEEQGGLTSRASGLSVGRKSRRFLASQLSPVQEAAIRCQVRLGWFCVWPWHCCLFAWLSV